MNPTPSEDTKTRNDFTAIPVLGARSSSRDPLYQLLLHELSDIYDAESQVMESMPGLIEASTSPELKEALQAHLRESTTHINRIEEAFEYLGQARTETKCKGAAGLLAECDECLHDFDGSPALDASLIACAQKLEQYEICAYRTLVTWAERMGEETLVELFEWTLEEEKAANRRLTDISKGFEIQDADETIG